MNDPMILLPDDETWLRASAAIKISTGSYTAGDDYLEVHIRDDRSWKWQHPAGEDLEPVIREIALRLNGLKDPGERYFPEFQPTSPC